MYGFNYAFLGHKSPTPSTASDRTLLDADSSSTKSGRRPSLDTVSTYLSQESRESQATASTADLLNCSASSDDGTVDTSEIPSIIGRFIVKNKLYGWFNRV